MDNCTQCNAPVYEECPYCPECLDQMYRDGEAAIVKHDQMMEELGQYLEELHEKKTRLEAELDELLDLFNDDRKVKSMSRIQELNGQVVILKVAIRQVDEEIKSYAG